MSTLVTVQPHPIGDGTNWDLAITRKQVAGLRITFIYNVSPRAPNPRRNNQTQYRQGNRAIR
jgi:hypothetical protein